VKKLILAVFSVFILSSCRGGGSSENTSLSYYSLNSNSEGTFSQNENGQNSDSSHLNPEPATAFLFGISLLGLAGYRLRRRK